MITKYKIYVWLLLAVMFFNGVFADFSLVCCYDGYSIVPKESCSSEDISLGVADFTVDNPCNFEPLECQTNSGQCTSSPNGKNIFNDALIKQQFAGICNVYFNLGSGCAGNGIDYTGSSNSNGDGGTSVGGDITQGGVDLGFNVSDQEVLDAQNEKLQKQCSDAGGHFGLFSSKVVCEELDSCLYNPIYGGFLTSKFATENLNFNFDYVEENPCVAKSLIEVCSDYKTKSNCENNIALPFLQTLEGTDYSNLNLGCSWIDSSVYSDGDAFFNQNGMCISNLTSQSKYFDRKSYVDRQNLIQNPSFENYLTSWEGFSSVGDLITGDDCWQGKVCAKLGSNEISQKVLGMSRGVTLSSSLYLQRQNFTNQALQVKIEFYDYSDNLLSTKMLSHRDLINLSYNFGGFEKLSLESFSIPNETNYLKYSLGATGGEIIIDGISLEVQPFTPTVQDNEFKLVDIVKSSASYCNLCFNDLDLNSCTESKSDLLGDCSYMVSDLSEKYNSSLADYSGRDENNFTLNLPWNSQSLANSFLFCEMYTSKSQCLDETNYVNSKFSSLNHFESLSHSNLLCQWDEDIGCFKDSNGDLLVDTLDGKPKVFSNAADFNSVALAPVEYYKYSSDVNGPSDFALGCDMIVPTGYVFFTGTNQSNSSMNVFSNSYGDVLGNVRISIDSFDYSTKYLESCQNFNFDNIIYFDYRIGSNVSDLKPGFKKVEGTKYSGSVDVKSFFLNSSEDNLLTDGVNIIDLRILDRSGNVGFNKRYSLNLDLNGPQFSAYHNTNILSSGSYYTASVLGVNSSFNFTIEDYSKVLSCDYSLNSMTSLPDDYYTSLGSFNLSEIVPESGNNGDHIPFNYEFKLPIYNTSSSGNIFALNVTCMDIFNQKTVQNYYFKADYDTNLVLLSPLNYVNYSDGVGIFNDNFSINLVSTDKNINDCDLDLDGDGTYETDFNQVYNSGESGFQIFSTPFNVSSYSGVNFYVNITVPVTLPALGLNSMSFSCVDATGNVHVEPLNYYLDNVVPEFANYSVFSTTSTTLRNNTVKVGDKFYTTTLTGLNLNLTFDGTLSCISNMTNLTAWNLTVIANNENAFNLPFTLKSTLGKIIDKSVVSANHLATKSNVELTCNSTTFVSNIVMSDFTNAIVYAGIKDTANYNLTELKYGIDFFDFAGNMNNYDDLIIYYDSNIPKFNFLGDVVRDGSILYTSKNNPLVKIDFTTPSYRSYSCVVSAKWDLRNGKYLKSSSKIFNSSSNNLEFNLLSISSDINITSDKKMEISFACNDNYGALPVEAFVLNYDNTVPILDDFTFEKKNMYFINYDNPSYDDALNNLIFDLADTNEIGYRCEYSFSSSDYDCDSSLFNISFTNRYEVLPVNLIANNYGLNSTAICSRKSNFNTLLASSGSVNTAILATGKCFDKIGLATAQKTTVVNVAYVKSELLSLDFIYMDGKAYPQVKVLYPYEKMLLANNALGKNPIAEFSEPVYNETENTYTYTLESGIDLSQFDEGSYILYAVAKNGENVVDSVSGILIVDKTVPELEFTIPDSDNGQIFAQEFAFKFDAYDNRGLDKIELFMNGYSGSIFSYDVRSGTYTNDENYTSGDFENFNSCSGKDCYGTFNFINGTIGTTYTFIMKAYDIYGNVNESQIVVKVVDGVSISLKDSSNSLVSPSGLEWISNSNSPIISFKTSRPADFCVVYPMIDDEWSKITLNPSVNASNSGLLTTGVEYSVDLSNTALFGGFDLSKKSDLSSNVRVSCKYNNSFYNYVRVVRKIDYLPDYVLNSSEGFVFNENPFTTSISVKSVGPYRYLDYCNYSLDGINYQFAQRNRTRFNADLSFSSMSSGDHELVLVCSDVLGNVGPTKHFIFNVNKNAQLSISNVMLSQNDLQFIPSGSEIYVLNDGPFSLNFNTNKKSSISCTYNILSSSNAISGFINFFKNLFGVGYETMPSTNIAYEFETEGVVLPSESSDLYIICKDGSAETKLNYKLIVEKTQVNSSISSMVSS